MTENTQYNKIKKVLSSKPRSWLITGAAGFIGSHLVEHLLLLNQNVVGLDNFSNGKQENLDQVKELVSPDQWASFSFTEGDIRDLDTCRKLSSDIDFVLHQAALGSVPRSLADPVNFNDNNITGTLNMLVAARKCNVQRFVYVSSSSVYGDNPALPKVENAIGVPLSPYAVTKYVAELYAGVFGRCYGMETIGLRYFNVFGPRQDPDGAYAAVIPKWIADMIHGNAIYINGTGETSRDFCYVENVVQANILAATTENPEAINQVYNIAVNARTTLNQLFEMLRTRLEPYYPHLKEFKPTYRDFRLGDIMHSHANIAKVRKLLGYQPNHTIEDGLDVSLEWYKKNMAINEQVT
ncbi:MAG: SDR family oxidoreductase [Syntrophales bacterium]|nr:SDR family oxidoreductase [Syntrophales bacterium]